MSEATNKVIVKINDVATGTEYTTINDALAAIKADATVDAKYTVELNGVFAEAIKLDSYNDTAWNGGKNIAFVKAADAEIAAVTGAVTIGYTASPGNKAAEYSWRGDVEFNGITFDYTAATDNANRFEILYIGKANKLTVKDCAFNGPGMINAGYNAGDPNNNNGDPNGDNAGNLFCTPWKAATDYAQGALSVEGCTFTNGNINFWRNSYNWDFSGCKFENAPVTFLGSPCPEGWTFADCTYSMNLDNVPEGVAAYLVNVSENAKMIDLSGATMIMSGNAEGKDASYILAIAPNSDSNTTKASIIVDGAVVKQIVKETYIEGEGESAVEVTKDVVKDGVLGGADFLVNKSPAETVPGKYTCTTVGSSFTGTDVSGVTIEDIAGAANVSITNTDANGNQNQIVTNGEGAVETIVTGNVLFTADETLDGTNTINGVAKVVDGATLTINDSYKGANLAAGEDNYFDFGNGDEAAVGGTIDINGDVEINQINADASGIVNVNEGAVLDSAEICIENGSVEGAVAGVMNVAGTVKTASMRIFNGGTVNVAAGAEVIGDHGDNVASFANINVWGEGSALNINGGAVSAAESMGIGEGSALNINGGSLDVASTLTNAGTIKVTGETASTINAVINGNAVEIGDAKVVDSQINAFDPFSNAEASVVGVVGNATFAGANKFGKMWIAGKDAAVTVTVDEDSTFDHCYLVIGANEDLQSGMADEFAGYTGKAGAELIVKGTASSFGDGTVEIYKDGALTVAEGGVFQASCLFANDASSVINVNAGGAINDVTYFSVGGTMNVAGTVSNAGVHPDLYSSANLTVAEGAVMNVIGGTIDMGYGKLVNNGTLKVTGEAASTINATVTGNAVALEGTLKDSAIVGNLKVYGKDAVIEDSTFGALYVGIDNTFTDENYFEAGYSDVENAVTLKGDINAGIIYAGSYAADSAVNSVVMDGATGQKAAQFYVMDSGSITIQNNSDVKYSYITNGGTVTVNDSKLTATSVNHYIFATNAANTAKFNLNNAEFDGTALFEMAIGSREEADARGNAEVSFNGSTVTVSNIRLANANEYNLSLDIVGSTVTTTNAFTVGKGADVTLDAASTLTAGSINNAGTITIDASRIEEGLWQQVVEVDAFTGNAYEFINVSGNIGYTVAEDGDVWLYNIARDTVYVNEAWDAGYELGDAIEGSEGLYFGINAFASIDPAVTEAANFDAISKIEVVKGSSAGLHVDVTTTNESGLVVNMGNNGLSFDKNGDYTVNGSTDFDYSTAVGAEIGVCPNELTIGKNTEVTADVLWANDNTRNIDGVLNVNGVYVRDNEVNVNGTLNVADNYYTSWGAELNVNAEGKFTAHNVYNNNGSVINVNGDAKVGVIENDSTSVVNVAGTINGAVNNNNVVNVAGTINGAVVNNADLNLNANSAVTGEITGEGTIYVKEDADFTTAKDMTAGLIYVGMDAEGTETAAKLTVAENTSVTADEFYLRNGSTTKVEGTIVAGGYNVQGDMDVTGKMVANPSIFDLSIYKGGDLNLDGATLDINLVDNVSGDQSMITVGKVSKDVETAGKLTFNNTVVNFKGENGVDLSGAKVIDTLGITVGENGVVEFNNSSAAFDTVANNGSFTVSGDVNLSIVEFSGKAITVTDGAAITGDINADLVLGGAISYDGAFAGIITGNGSIAATGSLNLMEGSAVDTVTINGQVSEFSDSLYGLKNLVGEAGTELFIDWDAFKSGTAVSNIVLNIAGLALVDDFVVKADVDTLANVKTINGVDVQHMNGKYFVDYDGISYELFDKNNGELFFDQIIVEEGKAPVTESTDTNTSLEGNVNTSVAIETKEGNTNVKVEKDADITVGGIYKQNGAGTNNVALSKNSSLTVNGDIEELGKLTTAVNSTLIVNGNVGGTDLGNSINITKGMMAYFESIDLGEGKDTFSIGAGAKVQVKEDVERVETIKLANGNANARSVLTIGGEISGFNAKGSITVGNYAVLNVEDGLDYEGNLGVAIKTGNYSITEFGGDLKTATISTGKYSKFTAENIIATPGNDTMNFGAYADVAIDNVDMGSGKKDTIKIGNNADVTIGEVVKVTDIKIGKDADVSFGNISYDAEAKKNTFDLGADADLTTGSITNVTDLKVGKGAEADFGAVTFTGDKASLDIANDAVVSFDAIEGDLAKVKFGKGAVVTKNGDWDFDDVKGSWDKATLISAFDVDETALDDAFVGELYANEVAEFTFDVAQGQDLALTDASEGFKAELYADSNPYNPLLVWEDLAEGTYTLRVSVADTDSLKKNEELDYSFKATLA